MKQSILVTALALLSASAFAAPTIDGTRGVGEGYLTAVNTAAGVDTNVNHSFGDSAKAEQVNVTSDTSNLYVFVEGSLHSSNKMFILIDSDGNPATGVNDPNSGTYGEANALNFFTGLPSSGGYDTVLVVGAVNNPATELNLVVLSYDAAGAMAEEDWCGQQAALAGTFNSVGGDFLIRGSNAGIGVALTTGDGAGAGVELKIPKAILGTPAVKGKIKVAVACGNNSNNFWSDSTIPQNSVGGNIGFTPTVNDGALASLTAPIFNLPYIVDGGGDGDSNGIDEYDTISAAIVGMAASADDGYADTINVVVNTLGNHPGIMVNGTGAAVVGQDFTFPINRDDIFFNGDADADGTKCTLRLAKGVAGTSANGYSFVTARWPIELDVDQKVDIRNFIVIPEPIVGGGTTASASSDGGTRMNCMYIDESGFTGATILNGAGVTLENMVFAGSNSSGIALDPLSATFDSTATYWASDSSFVSVVCFSSNNNGVNNFTHNINNVVIGGTASTCSALGIYSDTSGGTATFNISNSTFARAGKMLATPQLRNGIVISTAVGVTLNISDTTADGNHNHGISMTNSNSAGLAYNQTLNLTRVVCSNNSQYGLYVDNLSTAAANTTFVNINEGCQFKTNSLRGVSLTAGGGASGIGLVQVDINGTSANPVLVQSNGNRGMRTDLAASTPVANAVRLDGADYLYVIGNGVYGVEFNEFNFQYPTVAGPTFNKCIFHDNGGVVSATSNIRISDTNAAAGGASFTNCTFHDPRPLGATAGRSVIIDAAVTDFLTLNFTDCVFSGSSTTPKDIAIQVNNGDNNTVNLNNCSVVGLGLAAVDSNALQGFPNAVTAGTGNAVNQTAVINRDPIYADYNPANAAYLDIQNPAYAGAGSAASNLSGGGDYLGGAPAGALAFSPASYAFGYVDDGANANSGSSIKLQNTVSGGQEVQVTALNFTGTDGALYTATSPALPFYVANGVDQAVTVQFAPVAVGPANDATLASVPAASNTVDLDGIGGTAPEIDITPSPVDFGPDSLNTAEQILVTVNNLGENPLTVSSIDITSPSQFTLSSLPTLPAVVAGLGSTTFNVDYARSTYGAHTGTLTVGSDDADEATKNVTVNGVTGATDADIDLLTASAVTFDGPSDVGVIVGDTEEQSTTYRNLGLPVLNVSAANIVGTDAALFSVTAGATASVNVGDQDSVTVEFAPVAAGTFNAELQIVSNDPDESPTTVTLTGIARAAANVATVPTDFATLQAAIEAFRVGGVLGDIPGTNTIQIDASLAAVIDEEIVIRDGATALTKIDEDLLIIGINGRPNLRVQDADGATPVAPRTNDALEIETDASLKFQNLLISPSLNGQVPRDLVRVIGQYSAGPSAAKSTYVFEDVVFTGRDAAGLPIVDSEADAWVNQAANIVAAAQTGVLVTVGSKADQAVEWSFLNCTLSHNPIGNLINERGGDHTAAYPVALGATKLTIDDCTMTYAASQFFQAFGFGVPGAGNYALSQFIISNSLFYGSNFHGLRSSFGPDYGQMMINNIRIWGLPEVSGTGRAISGNANMLLTDLDNSIVVGGLLNSPIVTGSNASADVTGVVATWDNSTIVGGSNIIFGVGTGTVANYTIQANNCVFGDRNAASAGFGGTGYTITLNNSAYPNYGPNAYAAIAAPGALGTGSVIADPVFLNATSDSASNGTALSTTAVASAESLGNQFWAVRNGSTTPDGLAGAASGGANLAGGSAFIGDLAVKAFTAAGSAVLGDATIELTALTGANTYSQVVLEKVLADPSTLGATGLPPVFYNGAYWNITVYPANSGTFNLTLPLPDSAGFPGDGTGARVYHFGGSSWALAGTGGSVNSAGDPNLVTETGVTAFSPFAIGDLVSGVHEWNLLSD